MKSRQIFVVIVSILILSLALAACSRGTTPQQTDDNQGGALPTVESQNQGGGRAPEFFTEEFEGDTSNWEYEMASGKESDTEIYTENGVAVYKIDAENTGTYTLYTPHEYGDVMITATVKNNGVNSHSFSLVCRWTDDGHYEATFSASGLYWLNGYGGGVGAELRSDASNEIKTGKNLNEYAMRCEGNTITLYANGVEIAEVVDDYFGLGEGMVGFGVGAQQAWPVSLEIQSFAISEP